MPTWVNKVHRVQKKKSLFSEMTHGMPEQVFLACFELVVALLKSQNALKTGCLGTKNGSKMCFLKNDPRPFGVPNQVK